jgi:hypothetical protein
MHGHYTDILRCTVTILTYYDARSTEHSIYSISPFALSQPTNNLSPTECRTETCFVTSRQEAGAELLMEAPNLNKPLAKILEL